MKRIGLYIFIIVITGIISLIFTSYLKFVRYDRSFSVSKLISITTYTLDWNYTKKYISDNCEPPPDLQSESEGDEYLNKLINTIENKPLDYKVLNYAINKEETSKYCLAIIIPDKSGVGQLRYYAEGGSIEERKVSNFPNTDQ